MWQIQKLILVLFPVACCHSAQEKLFFLLSQTVGIYMCKESAVVVFDGHWHWEYGENHSRLILEICSAILPEDLRYLVQSASYYMKTKPRSVLLAPRDVNSKY